VHGRQSLAAQALPPDETFISWIKTSWISPFWTRIFAGKQLSARVFDPVWGRFSARVFDSPWGKLPARVFDSLRGKPILLRRRPTIVFRRKSIITSHADAPG
jgi:hypothetical protein